MNTFALVNSTESLPEKAHNTKRFNSFRPQEINTTQMKWNKITRHLGWHYLHSLRTTLPKLQWKIRVRVPGVLCVEIRLAFYRTNHFSDVPNSRLSIGRIRMSNVMTFDVASERAKGGRNSNGGRRCWRIDTIEWESCVQELLTVRFKISGFEPDRLSGSRRLVVPVPGASWRLGLGAVPVCLYCGEPEIWSRRPVARLTVG